MSYGIDIEIDKLVTKFTSKLWPTKTVTWNGRVYRNNRDDGVIPEIYNSTKKRYFDVLLDRKLDALCFFDIGDEIDMLGGPSVNVDICFAVNLEAIYSTVERLDERAHQETWELINLTNFTTNRIIVGAEAFAGYKQNKPENDMAPYHLFKFETTLTFNYNNCNI